MDQTNAQASTIDSRELDAYIDKAVDELFVAKGDIPSPLAEDRSAAPEAEVPDGPAASTDEGKLEPLEQSLLSLDWEVSEENIAELQQRVNELSDTLKSDPDGTAIINRMQVVCKYLRACGDTVSPLSIRFLHAATRSLNLLLADPPISDANRRAVMEKLLAGYGRLKADAMRLQPAARGASTRQAVVEATEELGVERARGPDADSSGHGTEPRSTDAVATDLHAFFAEAEIPSVREEEATSKPHASDESRLEEVDPGVSQMGRDPEPTEEPILTLEPEEIIDEPGFEAGSKSEPMESDDVEPAAGPEPTEEPILTLEPEEIIDEPGFEAGPKSEPMENDDVEPTAGPEPTEEPILMLEPEEIVGEPVFDTRAETETVSVGATEPTVSPEASKTPIPMLNLETLAPRPAKAEPGVEKNAPDIGQFEDPIPMLEPDEGELASPDSPEKGSAAQLHREDQPRFEPEEDTERARSPHSDRPSAPYNTSDETCVGGKTCSEPGGSPDSVPDPAERKSDSGSSFGAQSEPQEQPDSEHRPSEGVATPRILDEGSVSQDSETASQLPRSERVEQAIERAERLAEALQTASLETEQFFDRVLRSTSGKPALERVTNAFLKARESLGAHLASTQQIAEALLEDLGGMKASEGPDPQSKASAANCCPLQSQVAPIQKATQRLNEAIAVLESRLEGQDPRSLPVESKVQQSDKAIPETRAEEPVSGPDSDCPPDRHVMSPSASPVYLVSVGGRLLGVPVDAVVGVFPVPKRKREKLLSQEYLKLKDLKPTFRAWRPELSGALASADASEMAEFEFPILTRCGEVAGGNGSRSGSDAGGVVLLQTPSGYGALFTDEVLDRTHTEAAGTVPLVFG